MKAVFTGVMAITLSALLAMEHTFGLRQIEVVRMRDKDKRISNY